ncbi:hypothetical protein KCP77_14490 [Salmonella enterica subsp. enterica]|nr:hypothetical protein KCP77_14490 [Salmonella enterica subsp. enterica]
MERPIRRGKVRCHLLFLKRKIACLYRGMNIVVLTASAFQPELTGLCLCRGCVSVSMGGSRKGIHGEIRPSALMPMRVFWRLWWFT